MKSRIHSAIALSLLPSALCLGLSAQPTNFTYQGVLHESGSPANGLYDFQFVIYNGPDFGAPGISALLSAEVMDVPVSNGLFTAQIPFAAWVFNGEQRWLEVQMRTNDSGDYTGLMPWTEISPTPYAVRALNVTSNALSDFGGAASFSNPSNTFSGDGSGLTGVTLDGATAADFWQVGGNAGTPPGTAYLGTTDNQPLEFRVNNTRALKIESTVTTPNLIGGYSGNSVGVSANAGTVIAGGGFSSFENTIGNNAAYSTISGGADNTIDDNARRAAVGGGERNAVGLNSEYSTIGGGYGNTIASNAGVASIAGGAANTVEGDASFGAVGGGHNNVIGAGSLNSTISGGFENIIGNQSPGSTISGGSENVIRSNAYSSTIVGGTNNVIGSISSGSIVAGGWFNRIGDTSYFSVLGGGAGNDILDSSFFSVISGGQNNEIGDFSDHSFIGGGEVNNIGDHSESSFVGGGYDNNIGDDSSFSVIGGGEFNDISGDAWYAAIPGGANNTVGSNATYAVAAGHRAKANHRGTWVWGDSQNVDTTSSTTDQVTFRAQNGVRLTEDAGQAKTIRIGDRYRDNALLAWGKVSTDGTLLAGFGVSATTNLGTGQYEIFLTDTASGIQSLIPMAIAEIDGAPQSANDVRIVSIDQNGGTPDRFRVYINNGNYALVNHEFVFMVTAR